MAIHFDTQGPAPDGFHVPLSSEWGGVGTIMNGLGLTALDDWKINLHIPFAGYRQMDAGIKEQGSYAQYWSSSPYGSAMPADSRCLRISSYSGVRTTSNASRADAFSLRCFKNSFTAPTSSWTVINGTLGGAGIFRNQTEGLISITSNGTTGYTIQDKNLGATTVYNNGNTLSEANCGKYYQWGNNYGFPRTGGVTTSSTQVDASNYGPGNYYSSSTFITRGSSTPFDRSSVQNGNLWGGVSQGIWVDYSVYDRETGQTLIYQGECSETDTIGDALSNVLTPNYGITNISESLGGESLGDSVLIKNTSCIFYDVSVTPGCHLRKNYSAMQGPAPDGFHVPLSTEWQAIYNVWTALGGGSSDGTNFGIVLKLPFAGYRSYSNSFVRVQGSEGHYWSSTRYNGSYAHFLYFGSSYVDPQSYNDRTSGASVRCFKNSTVVPTPSWTKLYGTSIESGGIFWSSTDGLISLSSNGQTWITIADKNLGATTVWNSGDTLSEANCGKYYQRGNNYGFPFTGSVTTSSTQVDASTYGPGNYYSSDTFITRSGRWDTTDNGNLRGGETGVTYTEICPTYKLHGAIQTFHRAPSGPSLKSYEEIIAMSADNAVAELNIYPTEYYNKLNSEGHIYVSGVNNYVANQSGTGRYEFEGFFGVYYSTNTQVWGYDL